MKKNSTTNTSQDYDRKHKQDHIANNPRAAKDLPNPEDAYTDDKRKDARQEHTNHFTNREGRTEKK